MARSRSSVFVSAIAVLLGIVFAATVPSSFATTQICKLTCTPDPTVAGYDTTVVSMTDKTNVRGHGSVYGQAAAASSKSNSQVIPGSQSYDYVVPILNLPGRNGLDLNLTLFYNSRLWTLVYNGLNPRVPTFNADHDFPSYGFRLGYGFLEYTSTSNVYTLVERDGTKRKLSPSGSVFVATDSSFVQWTLSSKTLLYKNGTQVTYQLIPGSTTLYRPIQVRDANGNFITVVYRTDTWAEGLEINTITDTVGRVITFNYDPTTHALTSIQQGTATYVTFQWNTSYVLQYNFGGTGIGTPNAPTNGSTLPVLTGCTYTNGTQYVFTYGDWAIVKKIEFKSSSGAVRNSQSYDYPTAATALNDVPTFTTQTVFDGVNTANWTYAYTKSGSVVTANSITDPFGTVTTTNLDSSTGLVTSTTISPSGAGAIRTSAFTWSSGNNPTLSNVVNTLNDSGQQSKIVYLYDSYGNVTEAQEYDYGLVYKRRTVTTYSTDANYINKRILSLPTQVKVYDETGTETLKGRTDFVYDEYALSSPGGTPSQWDSAITTYRGNATTLKRYEDPITPAGEIDRHFHYDTLGNLIQADLDCCNQKSWIYDSTTNFSYPVSVTTGALTTSATYYSDSGLVHTATDENDQTMSFTYDNMFRLTHVIRPDSQDYSTSFDDSATFAAVTTTSPIDVGTAAVETTVFDGAGHPTQKTLKDASLNIISIVDSAYDSLGRLTQTSNPHTSGVTPVYSVTNYDALSRVTKVIPPDGTSTSNNTTFIFSGNITTVTDPAGKQRRTYADALGRLVRVDEPSDGLPGVGTVTISGSERTTSIDPCQGNQPPAPPHCPQTIPDGGPMTITVNGFQVSRGYGNGDTASSLATAFAALLNVSSSPVTASVSGAVITLTTKESGTTANYTLSATSTTGNTQYFTPGTTSFPVATSGATLTGGADHGAGSTSLNYPYITTYN